MRRYPCTSFTFSYWKKWHLWNFWVDDLIYRSKMVIFALSVIVMTRGCIKAAPTGDFSTIPTARLQLFEGQCNETPSVMRMENWPRRCWMFRPGRVSRVARFDPPNWEDHCIQRSQCGVCTRLNWQSAMFFFSPFHVENFVSQAFEVIPSPTQSFSVCQVCLQHKDIPSGKPTKSYGNHHF